MKKSPTEKFCTKYMLILLTFSLVCNIIGACLAVYNNDLGFILWFCSVSILNFLLCLLFTFILYKG